VHEVSRGAAAARNAGASSARGDILIFNDVDCIAHPEMVRVQVNHQRRRRSAACANTLGREMTPETWRFLLGDTDLTRSPSGLLRWCPPARQPRAPRRSLRPFGWARAQSTSGPAASHGPSGIHSHEDHLDAVPADCLPGPRQAATCGWSSSRPLTIQGLPRSKAVTRPGAAKSAKPQVNTPCDLRFRWWPGAGSNRRPSDFQSDARTN
jgi:Glycosyl transferase family 2